MRCASPTLLALACLAPLVAADAPAPANLPVTGVTMFTSGVAFVEHAGTVDGDATAELPFKAEQINDVLKSLVLQDLDGGSIGTVAYPAQEPLERTLRGFQVDVSGNPPLAQLLNQLRGAQVVAQVLDSKVAGTVIGVESRTVALPMNGGTVEQWTLNLLADGSLRPIALADVRAIEVSDPTLRAEFGKALAALATARDQDRKPVSVAFRGKGQRRVRLGYVSEAPVWKTSYRLLLPAVNRKQADLAAAMPSLQGWAVVENPTGSDWQDVRLTLVSGRPISFVQDLYQPLYLRRPQVGPDVVASLGPVSYEAGRTLGNAGGEGKVLAKGERKRGFAGAPPPAPAEAMAARASFGVQALREEAAADAIAFDAGMSISAVTQGASEQGELYQYPVGAVSLARGRSAMLPIVAGPIQAERVAIYNPNVLPRNPLSGVRLTNSTGNHLPPGPVTVYDNGGYAGDAKLGHITPGQSRLVSFAVDQRVLVDGGGESTQVQRQTARLVKGVLSVRTSTTVSRSYKIENQGGDPKVLVIEHARRAGWDLVDTPAALETTDQLYRFRVEVAANAKAEFTVRERVIGGESVQLADFDGDRLDAFVQGAELSPQLKEALVKARQLIGERREAERRRDELQRQIDAIVQDQNRIRENLGKVNQGSDYGKRLLEKLNTQETQLDQQRGQLDQVQVQIEQRRKALSDWLETVVTP